MPYLPPKKAREQKQRQVNASSSNFAPEILAKRTKRHLDELERSNYTEATGEDAGESSTKSRHAKGKARYPITDERKVRLLGNSPATKKKKSVMAVRSALLYSTSFNNLLDKSKIETMSGPTYLTAASPPPPYPPRLFCSVCGYWGRYKCMRCAMPYCDRNCLGVHDETRCEKRVV
ncbi:hypothetical protein BD626DRAFT_547546 [Schizophyllum amplum]|uniref:HIT-type domain-containing protein n=1 Tax=Schizophyllum amplum TaxID=97359 RepID=A0A550CI12_9AGAR|nr:hypothetical protein BD626DRAFT_547546 [Auriculariopsis ampla]